MVKDTLKSMLDNIKERTTNPFLGTLIVVWLIKNWTLVYSLFYFDSSLKLKDRLDYISKYFALHSFILNMVFVILITLGVLVLTYILLSLSRLVTDTQERIIMPIISKWTDKSSIVLKTEYIALQETIKQLNLRLEEERLAKVAAQNERDQIDEKLAKVIKNTETDLETAARNIPSLANNNDDETGSSAKVFKRVYNLLLRMVEISQINYLIDTILSNDILDFDTDVIKLLVRENIISLAKATTSGDYYEFTNLGNDFVRYWNEVTFDN